ncbi:MAG: ROK family protein [Rhodomicrobium sp.]
MTGWRLISDVGGTNVRFARAQGAKDVSEIRTYLVNRFPSFTSAAKAYLDETGGGDGCTGAAIGAAGLVAFGKVRLTNASWDISEAEVSTELGLPCRLVNDVEAVAFSLPVLSESGIAALGPLIPNLAAMQRVLIANIGTGFGAATLIRTGVGWASCPSEAGHMSLTFPDWGDDTLQRKFPSVEHVLSGPGLLNLHAAISNATPSTAAADIFAQASADPHCSATVRLFTQVTGSVLGNLVLAVAAWDGVFLCGSVAKGLAQVVDLASLRQAFEGTGRMSAWMKRVPIALLTEETPAFAGLAVLPLGAS